jgi:hypothetical protein
MSLDTTAQNTEQKNTVSDKEINFRKQEEALTRKFEKMLQEKEERIAALESKRNSIPDDDEEDDDPYVDKRKLKKAFSNFEGKVKQDTKQDIQSAVAQALAQERMNSWLENNSDFHDVMSHAEKFAEKAPMVAKSILNMPEGFERNRLVYETIKTMGLHKPEEPKDSIQNTIDRNRRHPGYQPTGNSGAGYAAQGDFSRSGQEKAYQKLKELQKNLRLG